MVDYWLDTGACIETAKGPYAFDIAPGYWALLNHMARRDRASSPMLVYHEIHQGRGELVAWIEERKETLFVQPDEAVYDCYSDIADHVMANYPVTHANKFLDVADPWLIAHAKAHGGSVVTTETRVGVAIPKPKIPNICEVFSVRWMTVYDMLRQESLSFQWEPPIRR